MIITRRRFNQYFGKGLLVLTLGTTIELEGCNWAQDILAWQPIGLAAFNGLVTLLETFSVITVNPELMLIVGAIRTAFSDLALDAQLYLSINPPPQGALAKIQAVLTLIAGNIKTLFSSIVTNYAPIVNLIIGLVQLILGTIAGFLNDMPAIAGSAKSMILSDTFTVGKGGQVISYKPLAKMSTGKFKKQWDAICYSQGHSELYLQ